MKVLIACEESQEVCKAFRNKNALLLHEIGGLKAFVEEVNNLLDKAGEYGAVDGQEIKHFRDKFVSQEVLD